MIHDVDLGCRATWTWLMVGLFTFLAASGRLEAQEQSSGAPPIEQRTAEPPVVNVSGILDKPIELSFTGTHFKFGGRTSVDSEGERSGDVELRTAQARLTAKYEACKVYLSYALDHVPRLLELYASYSFSLGESVPASLTAGRMFVPYQSAVPPPFGGMHYGPLTDAAFDFFGEGVSVSAKPVSEWELLLRSYRLVAEEGAPKRFVFGTRWTPADWLKPAIQLGCGPDPDEDWLASGEVAGIAGDWRYEVLAVARERLLQLQYGTHSWLQWQFTERWATSGQFDWLTTEARAGAELITDHYRTTLALTFKPVPLVRLQGEVAFDWLRRDAHQFATEFIGGVVVKF
ncbi:MAG: hypothetical protein HY461_03205 [Parcubacteria group bacterium]|nr:hypothetical protein [Parcubacteria group bacterium]